MNTTILDVRPENIPDWMKALDCWLVWRLEERPDKNGKLKLTKVPYNAHNGRAGSSTDPKTWSTFDNAMQAYLQGGYDGIGFALEGAPPLVGKDLDHCRDPETGAIDPWAREIVERADSYTEITPSGTGLRVFLHGTLPEGRRKMGDFEIYNTGRFLTVTGHHLPGTPTTINERTEAITAIHTDMVQRYEQEQALKKVIERIEKEPKIAALWHGELNGHASQSEADLALCNHLAYFTNYNAQFMDALFRKSKLYRSKWDEQRGEQTYGELTINKALSSQNGHLSSHQSEPEKKRAPSSQQIRDDLQALGYHFQYNAVTLTIEVNGAPITDAIEAVIRMQMRDHGYKNMSAITDVYTAMAHEDTYNPVQDYLDSLMWDGQRHILNLAAHFTCIDPPVIYNHGGSSPLICVYLYRWIVGAVAKVYEQSQNMMLVIVGPQGIGKSTLAEWLCSPLHDYFVAQAIQTDDKDSLLRLARHFVWEVDELDGTIRRSDIAALKGFITRREVVARPAYARRDIHVPALASMIGTVNKGAGFLADATGSRRFYVTEISKIDWNYTKIDVNQLWAQAVHEYKTGVAAGKQPWMLQPSEHAMQVETNKGHEARTFVDDWIDSDLYIGGSPDVGMTAADIVDHFRTCEHFLSGTPTAQAMAVAEALLKRGVVRKQCTINGKRGWYYLGITKNVH